MEITGCNHRLTHCKASLVALQPQKMVYLPCGEENRKINTEVNRT